MVMSPFPTEAYIAGVKSRELSFVYRNPYKPRTEDRREFREGFWDRNKYLPLANFNWKRNRMIALE